MDNNNSFYCDEQNRLNSFSPWFNTEVTKTKLARAGFFYVNERDTVICNFCEVRISSWSRGDDPFIKHKIVSPNCPFINKLQTNNHPILETKHILLEELELLKRFELQSGKIVKLSTQQIVETSHHPDYSDKEARLKSFNNWPISMHQTPDELSDAGFFYLGIGDIVKCFYCSGRLDSFNRSDLAIREHMKHFPNCKFIQFTYKELKTTRRKLKNRRRIQATTEQIQYLTEFMEQNKFGGENYSAIGCIWKNLAKDLNELGGAIKDVKGWREVWRNSKYNKKRKNKASTEVTQ